MKDYTGPDRAVQLYGWWVLRWRWPIVLAAVLLTVLAASGGRFLWFETNYRVYFSADNPQLKAFDELQNVYGKNDNVLFVLAPSKGGVYRASARGGGGADAPSVADSVRHAGGFDHELSAHPGRGR